MCRLLHATNSELSPLHHGGAGTQHTGTHTRHSPVQLNIQMQPSQPGSKLQQSNVVSGLHAQQDPPGNIKLCWAFHAHSVLNILCRFDDDQSMRASTYMPHNCSKSPNSQACTMLHSHKNTCTCFVLKTSTRYHIHKHTCNCHLHNILNVLGSTDKTASFHSLCCRPPKKSTTSLPQRHEKIAT